MHYSVGYATARGCWGLYIFNRRSKLSFIHTRRSLVSLSVSRLLSVRDRILKPPMDFVQKAASSYLNKSEGGEDDAASSPPTQQHSSSNSGEKMKPSGGNPAASAKVLLDAALAKLHKTEAEGGGEGEQIDNAKLAAASADVLAAAKQYGKLEGTSYGNYVDKAGGYLQKFGQKKGSGNVAGQDNNARPPSSQSTGHAQEDDDYERPPSSHSKPHAQDDGNYAQENEEENKSAPQSSHSTSNAQKDEEENKYVNYLKKAEEYMNKD